MLKVDENIYHGINIIEKLYDLSTESSEARELFEQASSIFQRTRVPSIGFKLEHKTAIMPTKNIIDVGYDITIVDVWKQPTQLTTLYETHVSLNIPLGYYAELVARSSLSKTGYMLANGVGIIDPGYGGTIKVPLIKVDSSMPNIELPMRVAQIILKPYTISDSYSSTSTVDSSRGRGGIGSTG